MAENKPATKRGREIFPVVKLNRDGYPQKRFVVIDHQAGVFAYGATTDIEETADVLDLKDLVEARRGKDTEILNTAMYAKMSPAGRCISITFKNKVLHLVADSPSQRDLLFAALRPYLSNMGSFTLTLTLEGDDLKSESGDVKRPWSPEDPDSIPEFQQLRPFQIRAEPDLTTVQRRKRGRSSAPEKGASAGYGPKVMPSTSLDPFELVEKQSTYSRRTVDVPEFQKFGQFQRSGDAGHQAGNIGGDSVSRQKNPFELVSGTTTVNMSTINTVTLTMDSVKMKYFDGATVGGFRDLQDTESSELDQPKQGDHHHHHHHHMHHPALSEIYFNKDAIQEPEQEPPLTATSDATTIPTDREYDAKFFPKSKVGAKKGHDDSDESGSDDELNNKNTRTSDLHHSRKSSSSQSKQEEVVGRKSHASSNASSQAEEKQKDLPLRNSAHSTSNLFNRSKSGKDLAAGQGLNKSSKKLKLDQHSGDEHSQEDDVSKGLKKRSNSLIHSLFGKEQTAAERIDENRKMLVKQLSFGKERSKSAKKLNN